jgi:hypothetical protein
MRTAARGVDYLARPSIAAMSVMPAFCFVIVGTCGVIVGIAE